MTLKDLGFDGFFAAHLEKEDPALIPARVIQELKGHYRVQTESGEHLIKLAGSMRFDAQERSDFPAVGDWVGISISDDRSAVIQALLPRKSKLSRKVAGRRNHEQVLAANVDTVFIVTALTQELNLRRIERYVALASESGVRPVVILNKSDLAENVSELSRQVEAAVPDVDVHAISCISQDGLTQLGQHLIRGKTCVFLGSSGVGKSTIVNRLLGNGIQSTGPVRSSDDRGRHTTTSRHLFVLPQDSLAPGAIVIDTPGMRELQLWDAEAGVALAFDDLSAIAQQCRFRDCRHISEPNCAVRNAIQSGELSAERFANYQKLEAETQHAQTKTDQSAALAEKKRFKKLCGDQKRRYKSNE